MLAPGTKRLAVGWEGIGLGWGALPLAGLAALLGATAVASPVAALAVAIGLVFVAVALRNLAAGLALFVLLMFFEEIPGIESSSLTLVKLGGAVLAAAWLFHLAGRDREVPFLLRDRPLLAYAGLGLLAFAFASMLWAADEGTARESALRLGQGIVLVFVIFSAVREPRHFRWLVWAFVGGAFLSAVIGMAGTPAESLDADAEGRLGDGVRDPNQLAAILVPALALASFGIAAARGAVVRWLFLTVAVVCAAALFMTESRGGLVALAGAFLAAALLAGPVRPQALAVILTISALGVGYYTLIAPPETLQRISQFASEGGTGRTDLWSISLEIMRDHPLAGVGSGNFQVVEPTYAANTVNISRPDFVVDEPAVAHNTYLHVLAELGIVGLLAFGALVVGALALALRGIRRFARAGDRESELLARGFVVGVVGMLLAYVFISAQYEKQLWLLLGVATTLAGLARAGREEGRSSELVA